MCIYIHGGYTYYILPVYRPVPERILYEVEVGGTQTFQHPFIGEYYKFRYIP